MAMDARIYSKEDIIVNDDIEVAYKKFLDRTLYFYSEILWFFLYVITYIDIRNQNCYLKTYLLY